MSSCLPIIAYETTQPYTDGNRMHAVWSMLPNLLANDGNNERCELAIQPSTDGNSKDGQIHSTNLSPMSE